MTMRAAYVPVLAVGQETGFSERLFNAPEETEGRFDEKVETIDQSIESD